MSYRFEAGEGIQAGLRRIATEQIDAGLRELDDPDLGRHDTVHQVRKRCKKVRGLLRIVRPALGPVFGEENARFRDAARELSFLRDAAALLESYDALAAGCEEGAASEWPAGIRAVLLQRRQECAEDRDLPGKLERFAKTFHAARERCATWSLDGPPGAGFGVLRGVSKTYGRARKRMREAYAEPSVERFHEWRKRAKYHWYHMRLVRDAWRPVLRARIEELDRLADLLGDEHDLAVLRETLLSDPGRFGDREVLAPMLATIDARRERLRALADPLGHRLFALKKATFAKWLGRVWEGWEREHVDGRPSIP